MRNILVVEDEVNIALLLAEVLEEEGYTVILAENGRIALGKLDEHNITLIITDMMMPVMNGMELCQQLIQRGQHPPIIMVSGVAHRIAAHEVGAAAVLGKPFHITHLLATVHHMIG